MSSTPSPIPAATWSLAIATTVLCVAILGCRSTRPPIGAPAASSRADVGVASSDRALRSGGGRSAAGAPGFTVLSINDTYRIEGLDGGTHGGLSRVRPLREELEAKGQDVLVLHAGDLLYPAFPSRKFKGAQVVDALNLLDGDEEAFDDHLFATFGNHEFDDAKISDAPAFQRRITQSQFRWLHTNLVFARSADGKAVVAANNLVETATLELGGIRVGLFSITIDDKKADYVTSIGDPLDTARAASAKLRGDGAEIVIGLTHLTLDQDQRLLRELGADGPDLIFGGHEHESHVAEVSGRWVFKADADAASAVVAEIGKKSDGSVALRQHEVVELGADRATDPAIDRRVREWLRAFDLTYCVVDLGKTANCLAEKVGQTAVELVAEELEIRKFETNLGSWVADLALAAYAERGAQVAMVNSGSLRLNQNLSAGTEIERRHIEELFAYPARLRLLAVHGDILQKMIERSIVAWSGNGYFLQVGGVAFRHDPATNRAFDLTLLDPAGARPIAPDERIVLVVPDFLTDPAGGQDGYTMLGPDQLIDDGPGPDLKNLVVEALGKAPPAGIAPEVRGRICNPQHPRPAARCLAVSR